MMLTITCSTVTRYKYKIKHLLNEDIPKSYVSWKQLIQLISKKYDIIDRFSIEFDIETECKLRGPIRLVTPMQI